MTKESTGVTIKILGECDLVDDATKLIEETCEVIHKSRVVQHLDDDGCHVFIAISEVIT